ncbi:hypothetical protein H6F88_15095 [Oculatella sp. FACHB-28]|uniref:hypothetical protein n=1 Tax=Oculatella sp. FACHB-28 TaxID=2692845 RepID=UPI001685CC1F|nr:hypothetical protein [Oculatella sp. FACHB-28]MBD1868685.1 hypothetical protein [Cyanobacteria bacterium FACHB-471]MBD2057328.1 hypothetical protein [Oculatella sp. FACHB-28]
MKNRMIVGLVGAVASLTILGQTAIAQTELRSGVVQLVQLREFAQQGTNTVSYGTLADLQVDPNFTGDFQLMVNTAATILDGYTIVNRGGYFPENAGIPRNQQLTPSEAVYRVYSLNNDYELVLFRTPSENTSEYFIRTTNTRF